MQSSMSVSDDDEESSVQAMLREARSFAPPTTSAGVWTTPPKAQPHHQQCPTSIQTTPSGDTDLDSELATPRTAASSPPDDRPYTTKRSTTTTENRRSGRAIDQKNKQQRNSYSSPPPPPASRGFLSMGGSTCCLARPVILVLGLLLFVAFGGFGFLLDQFLRLPGFKRQIELLEEQVLELETQVGRLETAVDDLSVENDRFSSLNSELNTTVTELSSINRQFGILNVQLNQSNVELGRLNLELGNRTAEFAEHNEDLRSLVGFLNETSFELGESVAVLTDFLDDGVKFYQSSSLRALELDYLVLIRSWDCDFREFFLGEDFTVESNTPIGPERYPLVLSYVEDRILDSLCLDAADWETFIETVVVQGPVEELMTTTHLIRGMQNYTNQALQFYFPSSSETEEDTSMSLQWRDWSDADYMCSNLPRRFSWTDMQAPVSN